MRLLFLLLLPLSVSSETATPTFELYPPPRPPHTPPTLPQKPFKSLAIPRRPLLTYDFCTFDSKCARDLNCETFFSRDCPPDNVCFCLPRFFTECNRTSQCPKGEICAEDRVDLRPACTSKAAVPKINDFRPLKPPIVPGDGFAFSRCLDDSDCVDGQFCALPSNNVRFVKCKGRTPCYCQPTKPMDAFCLSDSVCSKQERCALSADYRVPICVSKKAATSVFSVSPLAPIARTGLTFELCATASDCAGERRCVALARNTGPFSRCDKSDRRCVCLPADVKVCKNLGDCTRKEVCAKTPFFEQTVCTSISARKALKFRQVKFPGICPVLISNDPPGAANVSVRTPEGRIVGGRLISPNLAPYIVAIRDRNKRFSCTGTLISERFVITAAHCTVERGEFVAVLANSAKKSGVVIKIRRVYTHPKFRDEDSFEFDISILQLAEKAPKGAKFMKLNTDARLPKEGSPVRVAGYGDNVEDAGGDKLLRQVDARAAPFDECQTAYGEESFIVFPLSKGLHICVGSPRGGCDSCQGDSGGPILQYVQNEPVHLGITSFGIGCGDPDFPGVYARTSTLVKWIREQTPALFETN